MSEDPREPSAELLEGGEHEEEDEGPPSTPFDHPFFLPVLLVGFTVWFGYDGWFNPDMEWIKFNRYGFGLLLPPSIYFTIQAVRDVPSLSPLVFASYALWLGYMGWLGGEGRWYNDTTASLMFNRYGCGAAALTALYVGFRAAQRARRAASGSAAE